MCKYLSSLHVVLNHIFSSFPEERRSAKEREKRSVGRRAGRSVVGVRGVSRHGVAGEFKQIFFLPVLVGPPRVPSCLSQYT